MATRYKKGIWKYKQVKGRITRTVEEKYIEYRDKKQTNLSMSPSLDLDHTDATSAMSLPPDTTVHDARGTSVSLKLHV